MTIELKFNSKKEVLIKLSDSYIDIKKDIDKVILINEISNFVAMFLRENLTLIENSYNELNVVLSKNYVNDFDCQDNPITHTIIQNKITRKLNFIDENLTKIEKEQLKLNNQTRLF